MEKNGLSNKSAFTKKVRFVGSETDQEVVASHVSGEAYVVAAKKLNTIMNEAIKEFKPVKPQAEL